MPSLVHACVAAFVLFVAFAHAAGPTGLLNDTGQTSCYDSSAVTCDAAGVGSDGGINPRQDARFGRDAKAAAGTLTKVGGGAAGFDFTKVCMSGELAGAGSCPADPPQGTNPNEWACTKDNVTNLIWSLESSSGDWAYATSTYPTAMSTAGRCGFTTGWRAPLRRELLSIVHRGASSPSIDGNYFPATQAWYWCNDVDAANAAKAWGINFQIGHTYVEAKTYSIHVRLVHSGP